MDNIAEFLVNLLKNLDLKARWIAIVFAVVLFLAVLVSLEFSTGYMFYQNLERRVMLLRELQTIANAGIATNTELYPIYRSTAEELSRPRIPGLVLATINYSDQDTLLKSLGGASLWILVILATVSSDISKRKFSKTTIGITLVVAVFAVFFSWVGALLPTILNPWVNILGFPIAQFIFLYQIFGRGKQPNISPEQVVQSPH